MLKQKTKIIKLRKQQHRLKFWKKYGAWILCVNALIPISLVLPIVVMAPVGLTIALISSIYLGTSILASVFHDLFAEKKLQDKIGDLDYEILQLVQNDEEEFEILKEYDKIETLEREIHQKETAKREQKSLVAQLIAKKNQEAKRQQNYIKELTRKKKLEAKDKAIEEIASMNEENIELNNN